MPVDIRSFFQKKAPKKKATTTTANAEASSSSKRKRQVAPEEEEQQKDKQQDAKPVEQESKKAVAKKNDSEKTKKKPSPGKRKRVIVDSDDDDDEDFVKTTTTASSPARASSRRAASQTKHDDDEKVEMSASEYFKKSPKASPAKKAKTTTPTKEEPEQQEAGSPAKRAKTTPTKPTTKNSSKKASAKKTKEPKLLAPEQVSSVPFLSLDQAAPECLAGYTFCITAVDPDWSRDDATEFLKGLGARVTTAVSGKTDYLFVMGEQLEDDRPYTDGSKYKRATELGTRIVVGRSLLNGIVKFHSDQKGGVVSTIKEEAAPVKAESSTNNAVPQQEPPKPAAKVVNNPYARKKPVVNPYAKKTSSTAAATNPYAAKKPATAKPATPVKSAAKALPKANSATMLWVDKYKPQSSQDILGNADSVRKLRSWLNSWEGIFNKDSVVGKAYSNPKGPWKAVLLSGPPGIGKTTTATLVAQESGRHVLEFNASDVRSKKSLKEDVGDITGSRTLRFGKQLGEPAKRAIIMDEVDGLGAGDRGGLAELIQMIKHSRVPIICICNDRQSQKIKSLVPYCMDLKYRRPVKTTIASRIMEVARREGFTVEQNAAEMLAESCGNDVRQCLNACQMWASEMGGNVRMSYTNLKEREKSINKDEMLRVSLFDATRLIVQGRNGLNGASTPEAERAHFLKRNDAFFVDYNFTGLMVQQNYLSVLKGPFSKAAVAKSSQETEDALDRMSKASEALSDFALVEHKLRSDQNWSVLPFVGSLTVKAGYHAGGEMGGFMGGFPEFSAWLGKNSSKGKKTRMIQDLQHHMNYKISGGSEEMRLSYLPVLREKFLSILQRKDGSGNEEAIELMDTYGLDRDDILEKFDEFKMDPKDKGFSKLDSKQKASLTKAYNAGSHKSQALVVEQGGAKKSKRKAGGVDQLDDLDVVDDDKKLEEEEEEDDELDAAAVAAMFKKKGRRGAAKKGAAAKSKGATKAAPKRKTK